MSVCMYKTLFYSRENLYYPQLNISMSSPRTVAVCVFVFVCLFVSECKGVDEGYKPAPTCARLECPPYKLVHTQKEFEIRSYDEGLWLSSPEITALTYKEGASKGFRMYVITSFPLLFFLILGVCPMRGCLVCLAD